MDKINSNEPIEKQLEQLMVKVKKNGKVIDEITRDTIRMKRTKNADPLKYPCNN
ncbi:MAG: hypothetical protein V4560_10650 [Bacteroidota bacterium]